jgi:hypothetical protein
MRYEGSERRRYPRSKRGFPVIVDDGGPGVLNHVDNIGPNGVLCHTVKPVPLMTKMSIALHLPAMEGNRVECEGIVVRCEPDESGDDHFKVAILFMDISEEIQRAILDYVEQDQDVPPDQDA